MFVKMVMGTVFALPLLILVASIMIVSFAFTLGLWESLPVWGILFFTFPLLYMLTLTYIADNWERGSLSILVRNPEMWVVYIFVLALLSVPVAGIVFPYFRGYWTTIPWGEAFDLLLRAISVSSILPALSYMFASFGLRTEQSADVLLTSPHSQVDQTTFSSSQ
jgi:hypothetical protein